MKYLHFIVALFASSLFCYNIQAQTAVSSQISSAQADSEEIVSSGIVNINSTSLEVFNDTNGIQKIGLHFKNLNIPIGSVIDSAYVEFIPSNQSPDSLSVNVYAEASNNPQIWTTNNQDITNRTKTNTLVNLTPYDYNIIPYGVNSVIMQSHDLSPIIQELVNRPGYQSQDAINFIIERDYGGNQGVVSYDAGSSDSPKFFVIYTPDNEAPVAPTLSFTSQTDNSVNLNWTFSTDNNIIAGYRIYKNGLLETTLGNVLSYQVIGLTASTAYNFTVTALDAAGNESAVSNAVAITTDAASGGGTGSYWSLNNQDVYYNTGNVGIGTSIPDSKLTVKGSIHSEEVKVDLSVPAPDYVFESSYNLTPLQKLQEYILTHGHLPNIPSAKDMEANGVELGVMSMKLLEKIEELTLYLLMKENRIEVLENRIEVLERSIKKNK